MNKHLIVTTCGTSLLTNDLHSEADTSLRKLLQRHTNDLEANIPADALAELRAHIARRRDQLLAASPKQACVASAELNGILNFHGQPAALPSQDVHVLIHTDTWLGQQVAEILQDKLTRLAASAQLQCATALNTADYNRFREGLVNLVGWASQTLPGYRDSQYRVIFNLVGGFKSLQGFMQTLGMFYADEILYIFESSSQLLRIPKLPVDLDESARTLIADSLPVFRRLDILKSLPLATPELQGVPQSFLSELDGEVEFSPWGKILWEQAKPALYRARLHESPTEKIALGEKFRRDATGLPPQRMEILNTRIDDLARLLLDPNRPNPRRLDLKSLRGNPMPPSTHECDAWADADCRRIFLTLDADRATLNRVTSPLH
jgi:putative CRISPR-associated protein (TIGR02619 family)